MKVYLNGKRLRDVYPHATRWQVFKYKVRKFFVKVVQVAFVIGSLYVAGAVGATFFPNTVYATKEVHVDVLPEKIDGLKDDVVARLMQCESGGYDEDDGIIIFDTNKVASIGQAQFQAKTVVYYYKKLYGKEITTKQAVEIALDKSKAADLAKDVIFTVDGGVDNWYNCAKKLGLHSEIAVIKKLSK